MKHVGVNVAADHIFSLSYMGVNGGLVIVTADDPGTGITEKLTDLAVEMDNVRILNIIM